MDEGHSFHKLAVRERLEKIDWQKYYLNLPFKLILALA